VCGVTKGGKREWVKTVWGFGFDDRTTGGERVFQNPETEKNRLKAKTNLRKRKCVKM